ncbi:TIGR03936 family radical SAM-associated protein [Desulfothermobacter acidiphilus]|uniref:TIGR03936 family radical SAM-associated protein n=1 Tax=Desulfothermobacter acidiphilus TaxID=1938353 RepID=UPI003F8B67E2
MYRYRLVFAKEEPVCWVGHLDTVRLWEQALRRSALPLAYSEGFSPRPRLVFAAPLGVGVRGKAELVDVFLTAFLPPQGLREELAPHLLRGLTLLDVRRIPVEVPSLASLVAAALYRAEGELPGVTAAAAGEAVRALLAATSLPWRRRSPKGEKEVDLRPGLKKLSVEVEGDRVRLEMVVTTGQKGSVRPEEVVAYFLQSGGWDTEPEDFIYQRESFFLQQGEKLAPLF